ncbi:MAG: histidinol-phosphate transaminase [Desulfobacterales bacterium]|nr:histidinol-phosphate transaminase [Desulfobacterales bacterium]
MFSQRFNQLTPYVPGEQPQDRQYIKLNTNENPYSPAPGVSKVLKEFDAGALRRYPDPNADGLCQAIAEAHGIQREQVMVGNGSDEVLSFVFFAFFGSEKGPLLFPEHTYSFYPVYCDYYGIDYEKVALSDGYIIDIDGYMGRKACGAIIANPNAPTGILLPLSEVEAFLKRWPKDRVLVVDEAYIDFGGESAVTLIGKYSNLLVVRTFSKSLSLAGSRLGWAMGDEKLINALYAVKDSFNSYPVDSITQQIGIAAMKDRDWFDKTRAMVMEERERVGKALSEMGWAVLPSSTNFLFASAPGMDGKMVYEGLKSEGILVRFFNKPGLTPFVRITIGSHEENTVLLDGVRRIVGEG